MPADRRILGPLDTETAPEVVENGRSAALRNVQPERGYVTTVRGNLPVGNPLTVLPGVSLVVGACADPDTKGVVWLQYNDAGLHRLVRWLPGLPSPVVLLTWAGLNLPSRRGFTHACVLEGQFMYLDAAGAVRSVTLSRAAAGEYSTALLTADPYALHLVKQPPHLPPTVARDTNASTTDPRAQINRIAAYAWQFAYQYEYPDGERTPLSPHSDVLRPRLSVAPLAANSGVTSDDRNLIRVSYPSGPLAPSPLVKAVRLLVRRAESDVWQVAGTFTAGVDYEFYGETTGETLTGAEAAKLAEALPRRVGALTVAHSRPFVGDCTEGDAPTLPAGALSVFATTVSGGGPTEMVTVWTVRIDYTYPEAGDDGNPVEQIGTRTRYWKLASGTNPDPSSTYRKLGYNAGTNTYYVLDPTIINTYATAFQGVFGDEIDSSRVISSATSAVYTNSAPPADTDRTLHERSDYPVGVAYFDAQGRTAGAEALTSVVVPRQDYANPLARALAWSLPASTVPPAWAHSYGIVVGPNRRASFFLEYTADAVKQFRGDNPDGTPVLENINANGAQFTKQVWVSAAPLLAQGRGYAFEAGDRLRFVQGDGIWYDYPLLGQRGGYLLVAPAAVNLWFYPPAGFALLPTTPIIEIYRPAVPLTTQVLYEQGPHYPITDPGTPAAALSVTSGVVSGDCVFQPLADITEAMLPPTSQWGAWQDMRRGRAIPVLPDGVQVRRSTLVRFGGEKVQGSRLNGLGSWDALDQRALPLEAGPVVALHLASPGQSEGRTLIAVQERGTETLYLGQVPLSASIRQQQTALLVQTDSVIGGTNELGGNYGTRHPGSVVGVGGRLFWWCADQGQVCRYAADGVNPLNDQHECRALGRAWARTYAAAEVVAGYDPATKEYVLCFGATQEAPALTVRYSERLEGFVGEVDYQPQAVVGTSDTLYTLQPGVLRYHTDDAPRLSWDGQPAAPALARVWANAGRGLEKTWLALVQEGGAPLWELTDASTPEGQATSAPAAGMAREGAQWVGPLLLDRNSAGFTGTDAQRRALYEGNPVQSTVLLATLTCSDTTADARLVALNLEFIVNGGQTPP